MASSEARVPLRPSDLSTYARIRNAALEGFAARGIEATSIRDVAERAGVSAGLVQHHFGTKAGLRDAVDEYVIAIAVETFENLVREGEDSEEWAAMGDTTTAWVRDNAVALRYVARSLAEDDPQAARIFDALVAIARTQWLEPLARSGALDPGVDRDWAAIHVIVFNLASVLLEPAISRQLPAPFFSSDQLRRWNAATTELYRRGLTRPAGRPARRRRREMP
jgi:TetR/AcrR family transcriptional regulator, regulator of cefoperazone and chloramphenicol sensitivity